VRDDHARSPAPGLALLPVAGAAQRIERVRV
jgi:hypothetical protein